MSNELETSNIIKNLKEKYKGWKSSESGGMPLKYMSIFIIIGICFILPFLITGIIWLLFLVLIGVICIGTGIESTIVYYEFIWHPNGIKYKYLTGSKMYLLEEVESTDVVFKMGDAKSFSSQWALSQSGISIPISKKSLSTEIKGIVTPIIKFKDGTSKQWVKRKTFTYYHKHDNEKVRSLKEEYVEFMFKWLYIFHVIE